MPMRAGTDRVPRRRHRPAGAGPVPGAQRATRPRRASTATTTSSGRQPVTSAGSGSTTRQASSSESGPHRAASDRRGGTDVAGSDGRCSRAITASARATTASSWVATTTAEPAPRTASRIPTTAAQVSRSWPDRRLVGEDDRRLVDHGRGHGEPPLLPTGELPRVGGGQVGEPQPVEKQVGPGGRDSGVEPDGQRRGEHLVADRTSHDGAGRPLRYPGDGPGEVR